MEASAKERALKIITGYCGLEHKDGNLYDGAKQYDLDTYFCPGFKKISLGLDSLDTVVITMTFEEEFEIEITDETARKIIGRGKIQDVVDYIEKETESSKT